jgi:hypothetical protein
MFIPLIFAGWRIWNSAMAWPRRPSSKSSSIMPALPLYMSRAWLQLGRAQKMMGDEAAARKSYETFLDLWKNADPDIPIYQQAKAEYPNLATTYLRRWR